MASKQLLSATWWMAVWNNILIPADIPHQTQAIQSVSESQQSPINNKLFRGTAGLSQSFPIHQLHMAFGKD